MVGRTSMWMAMGEMSCWISNGSGRSRKRPAWISVVSQAPRLASRRGAFWPNRFWIAGLSGRIHPGGADGLVEGGAGAAEPADQGAARDPGLAGDCDYGNVGDVLAEGTGDPQGGFHQVICHGDRIVGSGFSRGCDVDGQLAGRRSLLRDLAQGECALAEHRQAFGGDRCSRCDGVDQDLVLGKLFGQIIHRQKVDDPAPAPSVDHRPGGVLGQKERALEVGVDDAVE